MNRRKKHPSAYQTCWPYLHSMRMGNRFACPTQLGTSCGSTVHASSGKERIYPEIAPGELVDLDTNRLTIV
jgi:hypothetical protein